MAWLPDQKGYEGIKIMMYLLLTDICWLGGGLPKGWWLLRKPVYIWYRLPQVLRFSQCYRKTNLTKLWMASLPNEKGFKGIVATLPLFSSDVAFHDDHQKWPYCTSLHFCFNFGRICLPDGQVKFSETLCLKKFKMILLH